MLHHFVAAAVSAAKALERQCPNCHRKQLVAPSKRHEAVPCGELIPAPSTQA